MSAESAQQEGRLDGLVVVSFESRRGEEMASLIRRQGGTPVIVPTMREVALGEDSAAHDLVRRLEAEEVDTVVILTGVALRTLKETVADVCPPARLAELLGRPTLVVRGPKPVAELRTLELAADVRAPEPNTWRELLETLDREAPVSGRRTALLEYGEENEELVAGLISRGADVLRIPLYRWELPEDPAPLRGAASRLASGDLDVALFTSRRQVENVMRVASEMGVDREVLDAAARFVVGSIGPICSETLRREGWPVDVEPDHPRMGHLVVAVARQARDLLEGKRRR